MNNTEEKLVTIRLYQPFEQKIGAITRLVGLMQAKSIIQLIDALDLEANPRNSKLGRVTDAIIDSVSYDDSATEDNKLFPIKTKGILIGASSCIPLERSRYKLTFSDRKVEGILDGGHNVLAIGTYILQEAEKALGKKEPARKQRAIWSDFKMTWSDLRGDIEMYREMLRDPSKKNALRQKGIGTLDFKVPVEILHPTDADNEENVSKFRTSLLEICDARNNNAELTQSTKTNQEGLYEPLKHLLEEYHSDFSRKVSWKNNDGGTIDVRDIIALAWIPLSKTTWCTGEDKLINPPSPVSIYSGKEKCLSHYRDLASKDEISFASGDSKREIKDYQFISALKVAADIPELFDMIYEIFPSCYNVIGAFGKITAVKSMENKSGHYTTPFYENSTARPVPNGFIYPLVYGLNAIVECAKKPQQNGELNYVVQWTVDPKKFVRSGAFQDAVVQYCGVIPQSDYDPQKVGKGSFSYTSATMAVQIAANRFKAEN
ncbi:MAG: hypothetical protein ACOX1O_00665 [Eggerthellaceae bacterium]|jgi:hypothetical protein